MIESLRSPVFWLLVAGGLIGVAALWWLLIGAGRLARRRALRRKIAHFGTDGSDSALAALSGIHQGIADAVQRLPRPAGRWGRRAGLYGVPWLLFIGDRAADVPGLLAAAHRASRQPDAAPCEAIAGTFWRWWLLGPMTAIETDPDAVCEASDARPRGLWHQALLELAQRRERLPLNGIVVCVGACTLQGEAERIDETAKRLRRLIDEASRLLRLRLPVYLVVNGLERLRGHDAAIAALPPAVGVQALGHRLPPNGAPAVAGPHLDQFFGVIVDRLQALRMALSRQRPLARDRLAIHRFVEDMSALRPGLRLLAQRLFEAPPRTDGPAPRWRGLYFTSAADGNAPGAFVTDLFERLLPGDQPLAQPRG